MSLLISTLKGEGNQRLNIVGQKVSDLDWIMFANDANKYFYTNYKMPNTQRSVDLLLFSDVFEYSVPFDFAGLIEPERPYDLDQTHFRHTSEKEFVRNLNGNLTAFKFNKETQFLLANFTGGLTQVVHDCDTFDQNGTWSGSGDGSAIATDAQIMSQGNGSIRFTVTFSSGVTVLTCSTLSSFDLTNFLTNSNLFLDLRNPNDTAATSVQVRIGSSASAYYQVTATNRFRGDSIGKGFGKIGFDISTKTTVGAPDPTATTYIQITINAPTGSSGQWNLDNIFLSQAFFFQLPYYSKFNVYDSNGTYIERATSLGDTIACPFIANEAITYKVCEYAAQLKLKDAALVTYFRDLLKTVESELHSTFPRMESRTQTNYYQRASNF